MKKYYTFFTENIYDSNSYYYYLIQTNKILNNQEQNMIKNLINNNPNEKILEKKDIKQNLLYLDNLTIIGPKLHLRTVFDTNFTNILKRLSFNQILRCEKYNIFLFKNVDLKNFDMMVYQVYNKLPLTFDNYDIQTHSKHPTIFFVNDISSYNDKHNLGFDDQDIKNYNNYYENIVKRKPTNIELFDLSQSNSEHSRHWFFNANIYIDDILQKESLFKLIKKPLQDKKYNSLVAFCDNSSVIKGYNINYLRTINNKYKNIYTCYNPLLTAETHNFPTGIAPFEGASTGIGGRLRDVYATGKGALMIAGSAGYSVGNLLLPNYNLDYEKEYEFMPLEQLKGWKILIEASNGASDYGNKIGEPIILGFTRNYGNTLYYNDKNNNIIKQHYEWFKPIMFTGGIGMINSCHLYKDVIKPELLIIRAGGPAYRLGLGGGSASSTNQNTNNNTNQNAVQRGNPEMENRLYKFIRNLIERLNENPILVIHDQGAGGPANVTKEIVEGCGGIVDLKKMKLGDPTLSSLEKWVSEFQESITFLIEKKDLNLVYDIGNLESVNIEVFGKTTNDNHLKVKDTSNNVQKLNINGIINNDDNTIIDFDLNKINSLTNKTYKYNTEEKNLVFNDKSIYNKIYNQDLEQIIKRVFSLLSVGSKRFLVNKVDRSVSGLVVQQQTCGYTQLPVSDYGLTLLSHNNMEGIATSIGEQPIKSLLDVKSSIKLTIGEMLTNLMFVQIEDFNSIKCSGNWMAAPKLDNDGYYFYKAVECVSNELSNLGIAIDGGKDSLSMATKINNTNVKSPLTFVLSSYVSVPNVYNRVTPDFKNENNIILFVELGNSLKNISGSALYQTYNILGCKEKVPDPDLDKVKNVFNIIQTYLININSKNKIIYSGHDVSDGGLITTLLEMAFSGNKGIVINIPDELKIKDYKQLVDFMFSEDLGIVLEIDKNNYSNLLKELNNITNTYLLGYISNNKYIKIHNKNYIYLNTPMPKLRNYWEATSFALEEMQTPVNLVKDERYNIYIRDEVPYSSISYSNNKYSIPNYIQYKYKPKAGIIREVGSNGEKEMAAAFNIANFDVFDINTNILFNNPEIINEMDVIAFVGGFSFSDTLGSANGWASSLLNNEKIYYQLNKFRQNPKKYVLGICNGFQLLTLLGWFDDIFENIIDNKNDINKFKFRITKNDSKRFESRFVNIKVHTNNSPFLENNIGDILGIWSAHGEGKIVIYKDNKPLFYDENINLYDKLTHFSPIKYIDDKQNTTKKYPFNPNGSYNGIASLVSLDNRVLGMMPHAERSFLKSQWALLPNTLFEENCHNYSPWMILFNSIYNKIITINE